MRSANEGGLNAEAGGENSTSLGQKNKQTNKQTTGRQTEGRRKKERDRGPNPNPTWRQSESEECRWRSARMIEMGEIFFIPEEKLEKSSQDEME